MRTVNVSEHYDLLIDEENDSYRDKDILKEYMKRWDGETFYNCLNITKEKTVLEVGIGTGRVAQNVLKKGCKSLTGLDVSSKTIERAKENLSRYDNIELLLKNIEDFERKNYYDVIYSVLTFMHIQNKEKALSNMFCSLKENGIIVLSISEQPEWLDFGNRKIRLFPEKPEYYIEIFKKFDCEVKKIDLIDNYIHPITGEKQPEHGQKIATIVCAQKN